MIKESNAVPAKICKLSLLSGGDLWLSSVYLPYTTIPGSDQFG